MVQLLDGLADVFTGEDCDLGTIWWVRAVEWPLTKHRRDDWVLELFDDEDEDWDDGEEVATDFFERLLELSLEPPGSDPTDPELDLSRNNLRMANIVWSLSLGLSGANTRPHQSDTRPTLTLAKPVSTEIDSTPHHHSACLQLIIGSDIELMSWSMADCSLNTEFFFSIIRSNGKLV